MKRDNVTYRILDDHYNYLAFNLQMLDVFKKLKTQESQFTLKELMRFPALSISLAKYWENIQANFTQVEGITEGNQLPDITTWIPGTLVFSENAKRKLPDLDSLGELLPVNTPDGEVWILNIKCVVAADESKSSRTMLEDTGAVAEATKIVFSDTPAFNLFKSDYDGFRGIFCTRDFKAQLEEAGLKGVRFSEELHSRF